MTELLKHQRYTSAGLAHSAADNVSAATGETWQAEFNPRRKRDPEPFVIAPNTENTREAA